MYKINILVSCGLASEVFLDGPCRIVDLALTSGVRTSKWKAELSPTYFYQTAQAASFVLWQLEHIRGDEVPF